MSKPNYKTLLELALTNPNNPAESIDFRVEDIPHEEDSIAKVIVSDTKGETAYVTNVLESFGFVPVPEYLRQEIASPSTLEYTNDPDTIAQQFEGDADPEMASALEDEEDVLHETAHTLVSILPDGTLNIRTIGESKPEIARSLDTVSDENRLKVIGNPDMMKFANKVYDMVAPGDDKSLYAAFLYDFDDFLFMYQPDTSYTNTDTTESDDSEEVDDTPIESASMQHATNFVKVFGDIEVAGAFLDSFNKYLPAELAKKKNPRGALLSVLMKAMSGEHGIDAVNAWSNQDVANLKSALDKVADAVVGTAAQQFGGAESE